MIFVTVSTGHFDPLIAACNALATKYDFFGQIGSSTVTPTFRYFRTARPEEIEAHMRGAELVIAHAGTGTLSTLYGLRKRTVVVPKQLRYGEANDGQVELALKWAELGIATLCLDVSKLEKAIEKARATPPVFPDFPPLGRRLRELLATE